MVLMSACLLTSVHCAAERKLVKFAIEPNAANTKAALSALDSKLRDWESHSDQTIALVISGIGEHHVEEGIDELGRFLNDKRSRAAAALIARSSALALGKMQTRSAYEYLASAASTEESEDILGAIAIALGSVRVHDAVAVLQEMALGGTVRAQAEALTALSNYCDDSSREIVVGSARSNHEGLRIASLWWLRNCGIVEDVPLIAEACDDPSAVVRAHALWGLVRFRDRRCCGVAEGGDQRGEDPLLQEALGAYRAVCN